jgi:hypothetical protein
MSERTIERTTATGWHIGQGNGEGSIFADEGRMRLEDAGTTLYPICTMVRGWDPAEDDFNARLVAAAPAMYAALQEAVTLLEASYLDHEGTDNGRAVFAGLELCREALSGVEG